MRLNSPLYLLVFWITIASKIKHSFCVFKNGQDPLIWNHNLNPFEDEPNPDPRPPKVRPLNPELYRRRYSEQTFIGTHNSPAIRSEANNWSISGNQYFNLSVQLESGVRLIQGQAHLDPNGTGQIRLCHFNCALIDGGTLDDYLLMTKAWLEKNPHEVVTFLFVSTNPTLRHWAETYRRTGFDTISYVPPASKRGKMLISDWPTIQDMTMSGQRAVTFLSSNTNENAVPYLLNEWSYLFETNFINDRPTDFPCSPSRPPPSFEGAPIPGNRLSLVNHFLYANFFGWRYPNISYIEHTNSAGFEVGQLGEHAVRCRGIYGRRPNFLLVDFWNEGDVWGVEEGMNNY